MKNIFTVWLVMLTATMTRAQPSSQSPPPPATRFPPAMPAPDWLALYAKLTGRSILMPVGLQKFNAILTMESLADTNQAVALIETELAKQGIMAVRDGEKFIQLRPAGWRSPETVWPIAATNLPPDDGQAILEGYVNWRAADLNQVLNIYSDLTHRTILRSASLACPPIRFRNQGDITRGELIYAIKVILALNGIAAIDDGEKFSQVVPAVQASQVQTRAPVPDKAAASVQPGEVPTVNPSPADADVFPGGYFNWTSASLDMAFDFYSHFTHRSILRQPGLASPPLVFRNQGPLTRSELIYGLKALLALNNIAVIDDGDKFAHFCRSDQAPQIEPHAPKPEAGVPLIDPREVPVLKYGSPVAQESPNKPAKPDANSLVAYYAKLTDVKAISSEQFGSWPVHFEITVPVTRAELLYAIEATLAQFGFYIIPTNGDSIHLVPLRERPEAKTNSPATIRH